MTRNININMKRKNNEIRRLYRKFPLVFRNLYYSLKNSSFVKGALVRIPDNINNRKNDNFLEFRKNPSILTILVKFCKITHKPQKGRFTVICSLWYYLKRIKRSMCNFAPKIVVAVVVVVENAVNEISH